MNPNDLPASALREAGPTACDDVQGGVSGSPASGAAGALAPLLRGPALATSTGAGGTVHGSQTHDARLLPAVVVGELLALAGDAAQPMVRFDAADGPRTHLARSCVDLHGAHIGHPVVLVFERGDPALPIVTGVLRAGADRPPGGAPAQVDVDADGRRMVVTAHEQLVLRCGKASITLTQAGKVLIEGAYVSSRSTGVNRIKGGSVQLN